MSITQQVAIQPQAPQFPATAFRPTATMKRVPSLRPALLQAFDATQLSEMGHVALHRRTDTKYVLGEEQILQALAQLTDDYRILEIGVRRLHRYRTLYFDTPNLALYRQHHNGQRNRYKVRGRAYVDSDLAFLEIKQKVTAHTTIKRRMQTSGLNAQIARETRPFLHTHCPYRTEELEAKLFNTFQRITLISMHRVERLTVDVDLRFQWNGVEISLAGIAIAEVKQDGFSVDSEFMQQMRAAGLRPTSFSKYCIGVSMLYPEVKHNAFNPQLLRMMRLLHERESPCRIYSFS